MPVPPTAPVVLLVFANDRYDPGAAYLRNLAAEREAIRRALEPLGPLDPWLRIESNITHARFADRLTIDRERIVGVHFGGHAHPDGLRFEDPEGRPIPAHIDGLAEQLAALPNLRWICLNGCATRDHVVALHARLAAPVIATSRAVEDAVATEFAARFYAALGRGDSLRTAFDATRAHMRSRHRAPTAVLRAGEVSSLRHLKPGAAPAGDDWPWVLDLAPSDTDTDAADWRLADAVRIAGSGGLAVSISRLPTPGRDFVGRTAELALLDAAWSDPGTHLQVIVGIGGEGKTALVHRWLGEMARDDWRGATRVHAWSFDSQGAGEHRQVSADLFIDQLLRSLGDPHPSEGDAWQKGERLAGLVRRQKTLLILDGVEPLQYPPGEAAGRLKDPALRTLLGELAARMNGLCIVTSRLSLTDLPPGPTVAEHRLPALAPPDGAALLRARGVSGTDAELEAASAEVRGHALALHLLGGYLAMYEGGDIRRRDRVEGLREAEEGGAHARRVMNAYSTWLDPADIAALRLVGLFDRAAEPAALATLLAEPPIPGLTDDFDGPDGRRWKKAVAHLRAAGLLQPGESSALLAVHPLVREHFGEALRKQAPAAWIEANRRLYSHFATVAPEFPDDLPGLEPLCRAVHHGCAAGRHREALVEVFWRRMHRGDEHYTFRKLGAFAADLAAIAALFDPPWRRPHPALDPQQKAWVLSIAATALRALGRLGEAVVPLETALDLRIEQGIWQSAAINAGNLAELLLSLGHLESAAPARPGAPALDGALTRTRQAVDLADRSGDGFQRMSKRTTLADALHQRGRLTAARIVFIEAERLQAEREPHLPRLYLLPGYRYGDLLLASDPAGTRQRATYALSVSTQSGWLLGIALDHLLLGRAILAADGPDRDLAREHLDTAVIGLRRANVADFIPRGLIARAAHQRIEGEWAAAARDLAEARQIAERGAMRLHLADVHLESARLALARGDHEAARGAYATACAEVHATAYHRRDPEVRDLADALHLPRPAWLAGVDAVSAEAGLAATLESLLAGAITDERALETLAAATGVEVAHLRRWAATPA